MKFQTMVDPVFRLTLSVERDILHFSKSEEEIVNDFLGFIDKIINSCNHLCRPEFIKLFFMPKDKYDEEEEEDRKRRRLLFSQSIKSNDIESFMFKGQDKAIYKKLFGRFKLNES